MITDFRLIDTKHQCIENCWGQVIVVNLIALVRGLCLLTTRIIEYKEEPIRLRWNAFIKERA